jgi:class 3 adenylate cyclase
VHIGEVMVQAGDLFGDGVNIAARLQSIAKPGGVCISGATYDQVRKALPVTAKLTRLPLRRHLRSRCMILDDIDMDQCKRE